MQAAARKVLDENQRVLAENTQLRTLLLQAGFTDAQINRAVNRGPESNDATTPLASPPGDQSISSATEALEKLLVAQQEYMSSPHSAATPTPQPIVPSQPVQHSPVVIPSIAASALLSPATQSYNSSGVSSPNSAFDVADEYPLSSPEIAAVAPQSTPQAQMSQSQQDLYRLAGAFSFQLDFEPQPTSWPRANTFQPVSLHPSQADGLASGSVLTGIDSACSYSPAAAGQPCGSSAMGQVVLADCKTREQEMSGYPAMAPGYPSGQMEEQWQ
jgi:hypothetical protein